MAFNYHLLNGTVLEDIAEGWTEGVSLIALRLLLIGRPHKGRIWTTILEKRKLYIKLEERFLARRCSSGKVLSQTDNGGYRVVNFSR